VDAASIAVSDLERTRVSTARPGIRLPGISMLSGRLSLTIVIALISFVSLGLPDAMLGVAWPTMRESFGRSRQELGTILFCSGAGYIASGLVSGRAIALLGVGRVLIVSTALVTIGLLGYTLAPVFGMVLLLAVLIGLGSGAVDSGLNVYAAETFSNRVMNLLHAFFGIGAMIGPIVMASVLATGLGWRGGYLAIGTVTLLMTALFVRTRGIWTAHHPAAFDPSQPAAAPVRTVIRQPLVWLQIAVFLFTTGVEFTAGQWAYTVLTERLGIATATAGVLVGLYWGSMAVGRLLLGGLSRAIGDRRLILLGAAGMLVAALLFTLDMPAFAIAGLMLFGLAEGPLFPTLMSLTPERLGSTIALHAIGFQVSAAVLGGAILPTVAGLLSAELGLAAIGWTLVAGVVILIGLLALLHVRTVDTRTLAVHG
jgi:fucose permease